MYGVSRITTTDDIMLISYAEADILFMTQTLNALADAGVVVDMICQTAPTGKTIRFSFTADGNHFDTAIKVIGGEGRQYSPLISGGYAKINLFGEDMVECVGVAAKALAALNAESIEINLITTSDLDISLLVRQEDTDVAVQVLRNAFEV